MAGSTGVLVPPKAYLERLKAICDKYGFLLIFDEVITGFGRLGASFAAELFGIVPDMVCFAKGVTNGCVPMGGVIVKSQIYDAFMQGPENLIEFAHGYTYSGHPLAAAAALATLDIYAKEDLFNRAKALAPYWEDAVHALRDLPNIIDLRNIGLVAGIELAPIAGKPGARAFDAYVKCFERGLLLRQTGDILALSPPLIVEKSQIDDMFGLLREVLKTC
jgi:beta-alanine--pyruvate transaminase